MIDFEPSEDQQLIIETVRQFAEKEIRPQARPCDEAAEPAGAAIRSAHELGLVANALPEEHGGGGARSAVTGALVAEELAWGDLATALAILSPSLVALPVADFGTDEQRRSLLPRFAGSAFASGSLALVEPQLRFDPFHPATTAKRVDGAFVLEGHKCQVPWLEDGDSVLVAAAQEGEPQLFLVPRDARGLEVEREKNMGIRAFPTAELELRGVQVPASARLGGADGCDLRSVVNRGRVGLGAMAVGVARAAFETARDYAKERHAFGAPIATKQAIAFKLADMALAIDGVRLLVWEAAWKLDQGGDATREAALVRQQAPRMALDVCDGAVQVLGGHGYIRDYLPEMHLRNARGFASFEALTLL